jgi:ribosomal protein L21E
MQWIERKWGIKSITISPYNSRANGKVERPHWDIRQMLYKATGAGNTNKWYWFLQSVLWADRTSIRKRTGYSPYYMVTGLHPILPLDAAEATWLARAPKGIMTFEEMIGSKARTLAKHRIHVKQMRERIDQEKKKRLENYERDFKAVIRDYRFKAGDLVLVRNTAIESSLDKKMKPRYNGPMIVVKQNKGGSYILAEMDGAVWHQKVARFRVVPYFARENIELPEGILKTIDCNLETLREIENQIDPDEELSRDYLMDGVILEDSDHSEDEGASDDNI